jgi:hypothetical protein
VILQQKQSIQWHVIRGQGTYIRTNVLAMIHIARRAETASKRGHGCDQASNAIDCEHVVRARVLHIGQPQMFRGRLEFKLD